MPNGKSQPPATALILIDHGSRLDEANRIVEALADRLRERGDYPIVEAAHMEIASPSLSEAFTKCVEQGAARVVVVPYFLGPGNHVTGDIPRLAAEAAANHDGVEYVVAGPLGLDDRLLETALDRAAEALE